MRKKVIAFISRSKLLTIVVFVLNNVLVKVKTTLGFHGTHSGTPSRGKDVRRVVERIRKNFGMYKELYGGAFKGKVVLEVGPGDNVGSALMMYAEGARKVVCVDAFEPFRDRRMEREAYKMLYDSYSEKERERLSEVLSFSDEGFSVDEDKIRYVPGVPIEKFTSNEKFDVVLSKYVLEHVRSVRETVQTVGRLLKDGGVQVHLVNANDHGILSKHFHPLEFLTIKPWLWTLMVSDSGHPNRVLVPGYESLLDEMGCKYDIVPYKLYGSEEVLFGKAVGKELYERRAKQVNIDAIRPRLVSPFREYSDRELLLAHFVVVARK